MTRTCALAAWVVLALAGAARADRPGEDGAKLTAAAWLNAPRKTPPSLDDAVAMTELPFSYDGAVYLDPSSAKACGRATGRAGTIDRKDKLGPALDCLRHGTGPFLDAAATWSVVAPDALPKPLQKFRARLDELGKTHTLVLAHVKLAKTEDWAVLAISYDPSAKAAYVAALYAAHAGR